MPSLSEVLEFRKARFAQSMSLIEKKGHDYNRQQQQDGDTLFNLRVAELLGIVPTTEAGILVRLSDKFMRLISLTQPGVIAAIKDESVLDTINDIHNYVDYLGLIWMQQRMKPKVVTVGGGQDMGGTPIDPLRQCKTAGVNDPLPTLPSEIRRRDAEIEQQEKRKMEMNEFLKQVEVANARKNYGTQFTDVEDRADKGRDR